MEPSRSLRLIHVVNNCKGPGIQYKYVNKMFSCLIIDKH